MKKHIYQCDVRFGAHTMTAACAAFDEADFLERMRIDLGGQGVICSHPTRRRIPRRDVYLVRVSDGYGCGLSPEQVLRSGRVVEHTNAAGAKKWLSTQRGNLRRASERIDHAGTRRDFVRRKMREIVAVEKNPDGSFGWFSY